MDCSCYPISYIINLIRNVISSKQLARLFNEGISIFMPIFSEYLIFLLSKIRIIYWNIRYFIYLIHFIQLFIYLFLHNKKLLAQYIIIPKPLTKIKHLLKIAQRTISSGTFLVLSAAKLKQSISRMQLVTYWEPM